MVNIGVETLHHIISGNPSDIESIYTRAMGSFSDVFRYDLIITYRMGRLLS